MRDKGWPIPRYRFAFIHPVAGVLSVRESRDDVLNRYTRIAKLVSEDGQALLGVPPLLDAQLVELTRERLVLSGIERTEDIVVSKVVDYAQTWICWLDAELGEG